MPIRWTIDPARRLMLIRSSGEVTRADVEDLIDAIVGEGALAYDKLFDASASRAAMTAEEMLDLGMRFRAMHSGATVGALAVVMPVDRGERLERLMGMIAAAQRPMRVFTDLDKARTWLEKQIGRPLVVL